MAERKPPGFPAGPEDPDDAAAWERATAGVAPAASSVPRRGPARRPLPEPVDLPDSAEERAAPGGAFRIEIEEDRVSGRASDAPHALVRGLARGEPPPEATLDLHGYTRETALREVSGFVIRARNTGRRSVLIVTGRGEVLRRAVAEWLARSACAAHLLAFSSAPPRLGGVGALLVLLRRRGRP